MNKYNIGDDLYMLSGLSMERFKITQISLCKVFGNIEYKGYLYSRDFDSGEYYVDHEEGVSCLEVNCFPSKQLCIDHFNESQDRLLLSLNIMGKPW